MAIFDRSYLPPAQCQFVVLSDTHYLLHPALQGGEWESIRQFPGRTERALRLAGALDADFVVHLGDVTHEYPETGEAVRSREGARAQFAAHGLRPYVAPGNMDIGDKPDPTSPAEWVTPQTLAAWHAAFGPSWFSFDRGGLHGVVLNSVVMNGPLARSRPGGTPWPAHRPVHAPAAVLRRGGRARLRHVQQPRRASARLAARSHPPPHRRGGVCRPHPLRGPQPHRRHTPLRGAVDHHVQGWSAGGVHRLSAGPRPPRRGQAGLLPRACGRPRPERAFDSHRARHAGP
ncbi:MAG: metallophosphoesterase [Chloroflexi bacterium]|nr:metallophosphoesterase [Chloroflexota bacterium]